MKKLLYLATLSLVASLLFAPAAFAQSRGPSGADGTFNCPDFDTQPEAQAYYESIGGLSGTNPADLDDDLDGVACETLPPGPQMTTEEPPQQTPTTPGTDQCPVGTNLTEGGTCVPQDAQCPSGQVFTEDFGCVPGDLIPGTATPETPTATTEQYTPAEQPQTPAKPQAPTMTDLPDTGGPALLLPVAGLLLGAGLFGMRMVRRRS